MTNDRISQLDWLGEVVDISDPLEEGRVKVRVFGKFDEVDAEDSSGNISDTWYGEKAFFSVGTIYFGIAKGKAESNVVIGKTSKLSSGF